MFIMVHVREKQTTFTLEKQTPISDFYAIMTYLILDY